MGDYRRVAKVTDIPLGEMAAFEISHTEFVIAHTKDGFFAVVDECSHDSAPISEGEIDEGEIVCPRHGARFDLKTGAVTAPPALTPIEPLAVKIEGDDILVLLED